RVTGVRASSVCSSSVEFNSLLLAFPPVMDTSASPGPSSSAPEPRQWAGGRPGLGSAALELACKVLCVVATCAFAAVGSLVGAVSGSVIGLATESGVVRGAGIGAISGAVFSIEVAESSRDLWHTSDSSVWSVLFMVRITALPPTLLHYHHARVRLSME
uniref:YMGG-like Gly-zipper domain-containing protein n=2 Tax=Aegilops tauschii subsp. strangulata TaxID=200361 RepID=A0A452YSV3_AEGTS